MRKKMLFLLFMVGLQPTFGQSFPAHSKYLQKDPAIKTQLEKEILEQVEGTLPQVITTSEPMRLKVSTQKELKRHLNLNKLYLDPHYFFSFVDKYTDTKKEGASLALEFFVPEEFAGDRNDLRQHFQAATIHHFALNWLNQIDSKLKKKIRKAFVYYPMSLFYYPQEDARWERYFSYCTMLYVLKKDYLQRQHPFAFLFLKDLYDREWDPADYPEFLLSFNHDQDAVPLAKTEDGQTMVDHEKRFKLKLFSSQKQLIRDSLFEIMPLPEDRKVKVEDIFGISLLIAGDEGTGTKAVGHSGLVILVCSEEQRRDLATCLAATDQHIAFNPMGDTYLYEHSPTRKIVGGGFLGEFPITFQVESLGKYLRQLNREEKRDAFISPPIITFENKKELIFALAHMQEMNQNLLTRGYKFFTQSCVHVCKNILSTLEAVTDAPKKHSWSIQARFLPPTPIFIWRYFRDQVLLNPTSSSLNREIRDLWSNWDQVIGRKFHFMFSGTKDGPESSSYEALARAGLARFGEDDHLNWLQRLMKEKKAVKNILDVSPILNADPIFQKDLISLKDYVAVPYRQRVRLFLDTISKSKTPVETLNGFYKLENEVFNHLDDFFEKSQAYSDRLGSFLENEVYLYHLRQNLDLKMVRLIDSNLSPMNLYSYLALYERGRELLASHFRKYQNAGLSPDRYNAADADSTTATIVKNFLLISEQIRTALQESNSFSPEGQKFIKEFVEFRESWLQEWKQSGVFLDFIYQVYQSYEQIQQAGQQSGESLETKTAELRDNFIQRIDEILAESPIDRKYESVAFHDYKENLTFTQQSSRELRYQRCPYITISEKGKESL